MPNVSIQGALTSTPAIFLTNGSFSYAQTLARALSAGLLNGSLTPFNYANGPIAPGPLPGAGQSGLVTINTAPAFSLFIPTTDVATFITAGPTTITGGGAGETVIAGAGSAGLTYTDITPSGSGVDYIVAGDGANLITTTPNTTGNYSINTGAGNDTIGVNGNAIINAGTGRNEISVTGGNSLIYSEGSDAITGSTVAGGGGTDTVDIGSGLTTINPGIFNFVVVADPSATNPLLFLPGTGSDTITVGLGGGVVTAGTGGYSILYAGTDGPGGAATTLHGTANGDQLSASGDTPTLLTAGAGNETLTGAGGTPTDGVSVAAATADNVFMAGSGNDTLIAGLGRDTLMGGTGHALMVSGTAADLFAFTAGSVSQDTITGFKSTDTLQFTGYGISSLPTMTSGGNTIISLNDGTRVTLSGVTSLNPGQVLLK